MLPMWQQSLSSLTIYTIDSTLFLKTSFPLIFVLQWSYLILYAPLAITFCHLFGSFNLAQFLKESVAHVSTMSFFFVNLTFFLDGLTQTCDFKYTYILIILKFISPTITSLLRSWVVCPTACLTTLHKYQIGISTLNLLFKTDPLLPPALYTNPTLP